MTGSVDRGFPSAGARTRCRICYDLRFPELYRHQIDRGAEMMIITAAWPAERLEHWRLLTTARAVENQVVVVAINAAGLQAGGTRLAEHSRVAGPDGELLVEAAADEGVVVVDIDIPLVQRNRALFPALADRQAAVTAGLG